MLKFFGLKDFKNDYHSILNYLFLCFILVVVNFIILDAMYLQYVKGELPCPLCLLERFAFFGVAYGAMLQFRAGYNLRHTGVSIVFAIYLIVVSVRQSLLDIVPRPGHNWIGSAILGIHLPIWAFLFGLLIILGFAVDMIVVGELSRSVDNYPKMKRAGDLLSGLLITLVGINLVSIIIQCGPHICHTYRYWLLS